MEPRKSNSDRLFSKKNNKYVTEKDVQSVKPVIAEYRQIPREEKSTEEHQNSVAPVFSKNKRFSREFLPPERNKKNTDSFESDKKQRSKNTYTSKKDSQVRVQIGGMQYALTAPIDADEKYIRYIAKRTNQIISQVYEQSPGMSTMNVSILALLNVVDEITQNDLYTHELEEHFSKYVTANESEKDNLLRLRDLNWEMRKEIHRLRAIVENYENQISGIPLNPNPSEKLPLEELIEYLDEKNESDNAE